MRDVIYVDHSATTYVKKEVLKEMLPYFSDNFGNASSMYSIGRTARNAVERARRQVAEAIGADKSEIYFTSGGSEADNLAIVGIARKNKKKGNHIITCKIEHLAVLNTCRRLEEEGFEVTYLNVDKNGIIDLEELKNSIKPTTILISIMFANNEIGTIEPIEEIGKIARANNIYFHTDAVQAIGNIKIDVESQNIDALSLSAHKFYGPKGVGAVYIKNGISFEPIIYGGHQENCMRAGTENLAGIVGLGKAIQIADENIDCYNQKLLCLRENLIAKMLYNFKNVTINGDRHKRLPGNVNFTFNKVDAESLLLMLDMNGICASSGSACTSGNIKPSHVLSAIGLSKEEARSSLRITFGEKNTLKEVDYIVNTLICIVNRIKNRVK